MDHLSDEWITGFDELVRTHDGLRDASADTRVVLQFTIHPTVVDGPGTAVTYAVLLDHGDNRVVPGVHPDPDLTLRTDRRTAAAVAAHHESAQTAFMAGRLRLGGDVRFLIAHQGVLAGIDDCAAQLRATTTFADLAPGAPGA